MYVIDIKTFLIKNKLTPKELAAILGITPPVVRSWRGGVKVPQKHIQTLLDMGQFDVSMITDTSDAVYIDRDILETLKHQSETIRTQSEAILSQQKTIEQLVGEKPTARKGESAKCADVG